MLGVLPLNLRGQHVHFMSFILDLQSLEFFDDFPENEKIPIKESSVSEKCNDPWNNKCDSMSADSQEKEILEKLRIQFIKGILNVLLKLILLFSENLHIAYFINLLEKKNTFNQWASYLFFQSAIQSLKNKINYF